MSTPRPTIITLALAALTLSSPATRANPNPVEAGTVTWSRDLDAAFAQSKKTGKPVFLLFQEIPGCAGCQQFGKEVLSQPLLVEAIENEFVPVLVYNNRNTGPDPEILKRFNEPAWNYQVVRFLDHDAKDIIPRKDRIWTTPALATRMIETLQKQNRPVPQYLRSLSLHPNDATLEQAAFAMFCFWTGEQKLGGLDGVVYTEAGWFDGREVTRVFYDPAVIPFDHLLNQAAAFRCADKVYTTTDSQQKITSAKSSLPSAPLTKEYRPAKASDQKRQLPGTPFAGLPSLNPIQLTKLNAFARTNPQKAQSWLSPSQRRSL
ncbi:MAG: VPGUxxT family thioredoxin-like (seleno)protein, type 2 [Verrucomicrobiota bacterium]